MKRSLTKSSILSRHLQSLLKAVASAKKRQDTTLVFRGETVDTKWIPEDDVQSLKLEIVKLIDMQFVIGRL